MKAKLKGIKKVKKPILIAVPVLAVILIAGGVVLVKAKSGVPAAMAADVSAEIREVTASSGSITNTVSGSGNLTKADAEDITVPSGITVEEVYVESGDSVQEGEILASLNRNSITANMASVQEDINSVDEALEDLSDDSETIKTYVSGRVKKIYASSGDKVLDVMAEYGTLMLLSMDGKMGVEFETSEGVAVDEEVTVVLADGTEKTGTVASLSGKNVTVTVTDNGTAYGETVTIKNSDGTEIGTGDLYINQEISVTGSGGTIDTIKVSENDAISSGNTLMTLTDASASAEYQELQATRMDLVDELQSLAVLAQDNTIKAPYSGTIETVNLEAGKTTGTESNSGDGTGLGTGLTAGSNTGTAALISSNEVVLKTSAQEESTSDEEGEPDADDVEIEKTGITRLQLGLAAPQAGAQPQKEVDLKVATGTLGWSPAASVFKEGIAYKAQVVLTAADGYYFAEGLNEFNIDLGADGAKIDGAVVYSEEAAKLTFTVQFVEIEVAQTENNNENNTALTDQISGAAGGTSGLSGSTASGSLPTGSSSASASGALSGSSAAADTSEISSAAAVEANGSEMTAFTISPDDTMKISISIDELDILSIEEGQAAAVTLDAVEGEFEGEITKIDTSASASGGVVSYAATITIAKDENMMAGMSASAVIIIESSEGIVTIPVGALQERGNTIFVYTENNENTLGGEVEVETGLSDGDSVEITSGLSEGDTIYYQVITADGSEDGGSFMMDMGGFDMDGGAPDMSNMPDMGDMPSGGMGGGAPEGGGPGGQ